MNKYVHILSGIAANNYITLANMTFSKFVVVDNFEKADILKRINLSIFPVAYSDEIYTSMVISSKYHAFLIEYAGETIGSFSLEMHTDRIYIFTFGILQKFRNRGIGSRLWREVELLIIDTFKCCNIELHVNVSNLKAIHFYRKQGFEIKDRIEDYYEGLPDNGAYLLKKTLFSANL